MGGCSIWGHREQDTKNALKLKESSRSITKTPTRGLHNYRPTIVPTKKFVEDHDKMIAQILAEDSIRKYTKNYLQGIYKKLLLQKSIQESKEKSSKQSVFMGKKNISDFLLTIRYVCLISHFIFLIKMGLELLHWISTTGSIIALLYVLWTDWVSQTVVFSPESNLQWHWRGNLREFTESSLKIDTSQYAEIDKVWGYDLEDDLSNQFSLLFKNGTTVMSLIIILGMFATFWLFFGIYNECMKKRGYEAKYPTIMVIIFHTSMITVPLLSTILWCFNLNISQECMVGAKDSFPAICIGMGPIVTIAISGAHVVILLLYFAFNNRETKEFVGSLVDDSPPEMIQLKAKVVDTLTTDLINANLPMYSYSPKKPKCTMCVLCTFPLQIGDQVRVTSCGHTFHQSCIDAYLMQAGSKGDCFECGRNAFGDKVKLKDVDNETMLGRSYVSRF